MPETERFENIESLTGLPFSVDHVTAPTSRVDFFNILGYTRHNRRVFRHDSWTRCCVWLFLCPEDVMIGAAEMSLLPLVASGDREACLIMRDGLLMAAQNASGSILRADAMSKAEVLARLAAAAGNALDRVTLAAVLLLQSATHRAAGHDREGGALAKEADDVMLSVMRGDDESGRAMLLSAVSSIADEGDDLAAQKLNELVAAIPRQSVAAIREAIRDLEAGHFRMGDKECR